MKAIREGVMKGIAIVAMFLVGSTAVAAQDISDEKLEDLVKRSWQ